MTSDHISMRDFFQRVADKNLLGRADGCEINRRQILSRMVTSPADIFFKRMQKIWGRDVILRMLADYFTAYPVQTIRYTDALRELPMFLQNHMTYSRLPGFVDMSSLSLKVHTCIYGPDPSIPSIPATAPEHTILSPACCHHFPQDAVDLFALWQNGCPALHESGIGCMFFKVSADESMLLPLPRALVPLVDAMAQGESLWQALTHLDQESVMAMQDLLSASISLWQQNGLLLARG